MEIAYSEELGRKISANNAVKKAKKGELSSPNNFHCPSCEVKVTCTNFPGFTKGKGKHIYFKCSFHEETHDAECDYASEQENKEAIKKEFSNVYGSISKSDIINLKKVHNHNKSKNNNSFNERESIKPNSSTKSHNYQRNNKKVKNTDLTSIKNIVDLYNEQDFDNNLKIFNIENQLLSLNDLFLHIKNIKSNNVSLNRLYIFHGFAKIEEYNKDKDLIKLKLDYGPYLYTNASKAFNKLHTKKLEEYIENNKYFYYYFRGYLNLKRNKWEPFNKAYFLDLLIT